MGVIESAAGASIGLNLVNGKIRPKKKGFGTYLVLFIFFVFLVVFFFLFGFGLITLNFEYIIMSGIGIFGFGYILLISPYTQGKNNYMINVMNPNSFDGFELFYKNKKVNLKYMVDSFGKFKFYDNNSKLSCISYEDGSKMSNLTKYKIINYFTAWLLDNDYLSKEVTVTFEQL